MFPQLLRRIIRVFELVVTRLSVWRWAKIWLRASFLPEQNYLIILAVVVGVLTGLGSVGFIYVLETVAEFARGPVASLFERFGTAQIVLLPALGGLLVGPLVQRFAREAKGHGVPEVMTALATRGGHIRKRVINHDGFEATYSLDTGSGVLLAADDDDSYLVFDDEEVFLSVG